MGITNSVICIHLSPVSFPEWTNTPYCFLKGFLIACPVERAHSGPFVWQPVCLPEIRIGVKDCIFGQWLCQMCAGFSPAQEGAADLEWIARGMSYKTAVLISGFATGRNDSPPFSNTSLSKSLIRVSSNIELRKHQ